MTEGFFSNLFLSASYFFKDLGDNLSSAIVHGIIYYILASLFNIMERRRDFLSEYELTFILNRFKGEEEQKKQIIRLHRMNRRIFREKTKKKIRDFLKYMYNIRAGYVNGSQGELRYKGYEDFLRAPETKEKIKEMHNILVRKSCFLLFFRSKHAIDLSSSVDKEIYDYFNL